MSNLLAFVKNNFKETKSFRALILLLILDFIIISVHIVIVFFWDTFETLNGANFMITKDGGYPEYFQYFKYLLISLISLVLIIKFKKNAFYFWLLLFLFLFLDDAFQYHESVGAIIVDKYQISSFIGLRPSDIGELIYMIGIGIILLLSFSISYFFGGGKKDIYSNIDIFILFFVFIAFGVGFDMLHGIFGGNKYSNFILALLEDGGEMFALTFLVWYFLFLLFKEKTQQTFLFQYSKKIKKSLF